MNAQYDPIILCDTCGNSMHDSPVTHRLPSAREMHARRCHSSAYPASFSYPTAAAVLAAGWTRDDFTGWPYLSQEDAFWQTHYSQD